MKTFKDIEELALRDPIVAKLMTLHYRGDMSKEQMMIELVCALHENMETCYKECVKLHQTSMHRNF